MTALRSPQLRRLGPPLVEAYLARPAPMLVPTDRDDLKAFCHWLVAHRPDEPIDAALRALELPDFGAFVADQLRGRRGRRRDLATAYRRLVALGRFYAWVTAIGAVAINPLPPECRTGWTRRPMRGPAG